MAGYHFLYYIPSIDVIPSIDEHSKCILIMSFSCICYDRNIT